MFSIIFISTLLISVRCVPLETEELKAPVNEQQQKLNAESLFKQENSQPQPNDNLVPEVAGGAVLPDDLSNSPDASQANPPGTTDLDTDATFWGWGYRRPYYYRSYYSPWRRWGWGGYGGWGGRGWGWRSYYW